MKHFFFTVLVVALIASACAKENPALQDTDNSASRKDLVEMTFTATSEFTKTTLTDGLAVAFRPGEKIAVFADGDATPHEFTTTAGGTSATFTGSAPAASKYYAAFPYSSSLKCEAGEIKNLTVSHSTDGTATGTFNSSKAVAVAVSENSSLFFKQVCALLKVTVPAEVTDLSQVMIFNRDESSGSGALAGTINVTFDSNEDPVVNVVTAKYQNGFIGPSGSTNPVPSGDYYIPVLPAQLTTGKGIDLRATFLDNKIARAFNGASVKFKSGKVYTIGAIVKTDEFVENGFESESALSGWSGNKNGSKDAFSVVENPFKTATNPSDHVMKDDMSLSTSSTSGYVEFASTGAAGYLRFPSGVRSFYDRIRVKIYLGTNEYYPRIKRGDINPVWPAKINGVDLDGADDAANKVIWDANVKTDDWNILDWNASQMDSGWKNFANLGTYNIRPFTTWDGQNVEGFDATTNNRCVYIDDITFVLK